MEPLHGHRAFCLLKRKPKSKAARTEAGQRTVPGEGTGTVVFQLFEIKANMTAQTGVEPLPA